MKVLVVCLGNICRSPIGEGILKSKFDKNNIKGRIDSAGILSFHVGDSPDSRAVEISHENGIDISGQLGRQIKKSDFDDFDLILTMDKSVHKEVMAMAKEPRHTAKVKLFLDYAGIGNLMDVPDPYYGGREGFEKVFKLIDQGCELIAKSLLKSKL